MKTLLPFTLFISCVLLSSCGRDPAALNRKAVEALNEGEAAKAMRLFEKAAEKAAEKSEGSEVADMWAHAGLAAARAGRGGDAEAFLMKAVEVSPSHVEANYNLGDLYVQQNRLDEAVRYLESASISSEGTEPLEALAAIALRQGKLDEAYTYLQQARVRDENVRVLTSLAVAGKQHLTVSQSRDLLQQAVSQDPSYAPAQLNLAALLDQNRLDPAQAMAHYQAFLRLEPEDDKVPLVQLRLQIMETREASGNFSRPDPERQEVEALLDQASEAAAAGNQSLAIQYCLQANAAATRAQRSDLRERALRAATTLAPDSARAQFGFGQFMLGQNRKPEAMQAFAAARSVAPGWPMTLRPAVLLAAELGRNTQATEFLVQAEAAGAANPDFLLEIGDLYAEALNNERESRRVYELILDGFPTYAQRAQVQARLDR
ncbi:tetratricopeptide repeat protein [Kiritimatiellota bacterium B12222]|nr:tetratricopeptide repeat protein [Kiritimatiellota bacterium B12222]